MSSSSVPVVEKSEIIHEPSIQIQHQQAPQPIDLATHRGTSVVQLRPLRTFAHHTNNINSGKPQNVGSIAVTPSIISVNRTGPLTILPARATSGQGTPNIPTYQIARGTIVGNIRAAGGNQPASITVTPISGTSNFGANIRLTGTTNGSWIPSGTQGQGPYTPLRATTITVSGRSVRPDGKMIHIPQHHGPVLQMVDNKGSIIKPQITPLVNVRGINPQSTNSGASLALPIHPFTIRTANINLPIQQRPQTTNSNTANLVQKVITQPGHGPPIQLLNAQKLQGHTIQTITPIPRVNTVCLTLSSNAGNLAPNSSQPVMAMAASKQSGTSLVSGPLTKVFPVRDGTSIDVDGKLIGQSVQSVGSTVTLSSLPPQNASQQNISTTIPNITNQSGGGVTSHHQIVQVHGPINVGLPTSNLTASGNITSNYYLGQKNIITTTGGINNQARPIAIDNKRIIATTNSPVVVTGVGVGGGINQQQPSSITIPIAVSSNTTSSSGVFSHHPIITAHGQGNQIITTQGTHTHLLTSSHINNSNSSSSFSSQQQQQQHPGIHHQHHHHAIPTHVISTSSVVIPSHSTPSTFATLPTSSSVAQTLTSMAMSNMSNTSSSVNIISGLVGPSSTSNNNNSNTSNYSSSSSTSVTIINSGNNALNSTSSSVSTSSSTNSSISNSSSSNNLTVPSSTTSSSTPVQSPSQASKSNLSPRPSILRKRAEGGGATGGGGGDHHHGHHHHHHHNVPLRAQRNLTLNFSVANNSNAIVSPASASSAVAAAVLAAANKENNTTTTTTILPSSSSTSSSIISLGQIIDKVSVVTMALTPTTNTSTTVTGISILKKEFQPPNEESSWQSCSSNSSSGSTTISTTSETAEIQLQQQQQQQQQQTQRTPQTTTSAGIFGNNLSNINIKEICLNNTNNLSASGGSMSSSGTITNNSSQNGIMPGRAVASVLRRAGGSGKAISKDLERVKSMKDKDESVSPRKKPRKQQLTNDLLEAPSPEISFYQGKRFKRSELMNSNLFQGFDNKPSTSIENLTEEPPETKFVYYIKKPHMSLLNQNKTPWKTKNNHFQRYCDVKPKEERRPTVNDLANQKGVLQKINGWKLQHLSRQMDDIIDLEVNVVTSFNSLLTSLEEKYGSNASSDSNRDLNRIQELLKGNIQRCKVIRDQLTESRSQTTKILDHKPFIREVINKYISKRPIKKRDRL